MPERWTIRKVLSWCAKDFAQRGIDTARLDAELLVAFGLGLRRIDLYMDFDRPLQKSELAQVRALVARRRRREPVAYILGEREFFKRGFEVGPDVLIPRPDTETLVEAALAHVPQDAAVRVLDLCTGSGAVAVSLAAERSAARVDATDISQDALRIAARNAERHGVAERVSFYEGDLFAALPAPDAYDVVTCNPPYVRLQEWEELAPEIREHEPRAALVAERDGLAFYERLCEEAPRWLAEGGVIVVEVGDGQASRVEETFVGTGMFTEIRFHRDLRGVCRVVEAARAGVDRAAASPRSAP